MTYTDGKKEPHMFRRWLVLSFAVLTTGCGYNTIQTLDERAQAYQGNIEAQLQRRADLIPNLVNTVKGYAAHEEQVLTNVTNARAGLLSAVKSGDPEQMAAANAQMTGAIGRLLVTVENYPNLKADQGFLRFQDELAGTENRIAVSRGDYNSAVNEYNAYIRKFPAVVTAKVTGAKPRKYFEAAAGTAAAPTVDFTRPATPAQPAPAQTPATRTP
ncbi:MAG: LemA family protein [Gemmatimonadaceae bacterium]